MGFHKPSLTFVLIHTGILGLGRLFLFFRYTFFDGHILQVYEVCTTYDLFSHMFYFLAFCFPFLC